MAFKLDFGITITDLSAHAEDFGGIAPTGVNPITGVVFTTAEVKQAINRSVSHITLRYYNNFKNQYKADTVDGLQEEVRCSLTEAIIVGALTELETPHIFSLTINPLDDRQLIQAGDYKWNTVTHANSSDRLVDSQTQELQIHQLLDRYTKSTSTFNAGIFVPSCE